ncbi:MAG: queuosine precursor transporter [Kiritimatiellales bacterium]
MSNNLLWIAMLAAGFVSVLLAFRLFGRAGLYLWCGLSVVIANIQVLKTVELFGMVSTLGNIVYASSFLATDILSEIYGKKAAGKGVLAGFFSLIVMTLLMQLSVRFVPDASDFAQPAMETLFALLPRVAAASLLAYLLSQTHDIWAYHFWKRRFPALKWLWLRNNASTVVSQLIDSAVFSFAAFTGIFEMNVVIEIWLTTCLFKWIVALADTPFIYAAVKMHSSVRDE